MFRSTSPRLVLLSALFAASFVVAMPAAAKVLCTQQLPGGVAGAEQCFASEDECNQNISSQSVGSEDEGLLMSDTAVCVCRSATPEECPEAARGMTGGQEAIIDINTAAFKPLGAGVTLQGLIGRAVRGILGLSGIAALVMFIWGGLLWMTAAGDSGRIDKAKKTIVWAALGIVAIFSAYMLVDMVIKAASGSGTG